MRALLVPLLLVAGCAASGDLDDGADARSLSSRLAERVAGGPQQCVPQRQAQSLRAVDGRTIVYEDIGTLWVSRLAADCPGLRPDSTIVVETFGDRYCRNDRIRALEPGTTIPGPICLLGEFTPYRARR